jgi:glucose/arabinose dehydrogenase
MRRPLSHSRHESLEARRLLAFTPYDGDLSEVVEFQGLTSPVAVEFASTGRVFVSEKAGIIKTYDSIADKTNSIALDIRDQVNGSGDRGLLGLAVSPDFSSDNYVYTLYTFDGLIGDSARTSDLDNFNNLVSGKLVRYEWNGSALVNPQLLIWDWPAQYSSHSVGHLQFGPDGYLYASGGEGANFNAVDYGQIAPNGFGDPTNEGGALRSQDILSTGDPLGLDGTLIRIDPATGAGAPGNPLANSSDANAKRVIANGLRNPYRFNFRPGTSEVWLADVGWSAYEEINRFQFNGTTPRNFGWPAKEGNGDQSGYKSANLPLLSGIYNGSVSTVAPYFTYNHNNRIDSAASNEPTGGSSVTGVAFYDAEIYPYEYWNSMFFADYARKTIYVAKVGQNGLPDMSTSHLMQTGVPVVEMQTGPEGDVFYVDITAGKVVRITSKGPKARMSVDQTSGTAPLTVHLDASASSDPDEFDQISFSWDLDNDGAFDDATGPTVTKTYTLRGTYTPKVKVTDLLGLNDIESVTINVDSSSPVPSFNGPTPNRLWAVGQNIKFAGSATDADDGTLSASSLSWKLVLMHAHEDSPNTPAHEHEVGSWTGIASGSFTCPDHEYPSWLELRLTATDSDGNSTTISRRLNPNPTTVTIGASTPGVVVAFNDNDYVTPFTRTVIAGSTNTLSLATKQSVNDEDWVFDGWNDLQTNAREYVAPAGGSSLQVNGKLQAWRRVEGRPTASTGSFAGNASDAPPRAFDNDFNTGFKSAGTGGWLGANIGSAQFVGRIGIAPLSGISMAGGRIQASNKSDFKGAVTIYTFDSSPSAGAITNITATDGLVVGQYRYYRYIAPSGSYAGVAEFQLSVAESYINGRGTTFGSAAIAGSSANNAFDGHLDTSYQATKADKAWVALDLGTPTQLDMVRFAPRLGDGSKMVGGKVQLANDASFNDAVTVLTINSTPQNGWNEAKINPSGTFRYARYLGANGTAAVIGEFAVQTAPPTPVPAAAGAVGVLTSDAQQGVNMVWGDNSILETGFRIRRAVNGGAYSTLVNLPANTTAYTDTNVSAGKTYVYRIIPMNASGYGADTTKGTLIAATGTAPAKPSNLAAVKESSGGVALSWKDNSTNETSYRVERRYANDVWNALVTIEANRTSYFDATAFNEVSYEYRVIAVNGIGTTTSDAVAITT